MENEITALLKKLSFLRAICTKEKRAPDWKDLEAANRILDKIDDKERISVCLCAGGGYKWRDCDKDEWVGGI